jgi:hypothetical protein
MSPVTMMPSSSTRQTPQQKPTGASDIDDSWLFQAMKHGNVAAFSSLCDRHFTAVYSACLLQCNDQRKAEQMLESAFIRLWDNRCRMRCPPGGLCQYILLLASSADSTSKGTALNYLSDAGNPTQRVST